MGVYCTVLLSVLGLSMSAAYAASPETPPAPFWGPPVSLAQLETERGGTDAGMPTINANQLNAKLFDTSATGNITGTNSIRDAAFAGATGFPTVIQNSGNNVIIQNGAVLNLTLK